MRFWLILTAGMILIPGCATYHFESDRPLKYIHEFRVNPENDVRYCTRMSEERGERRLRRLTETSQSEEAWIYVPKLREWDEIGINEGNDIVDENDPRYKKRSVDLDGTYIDVVAKAFKEFTIYHIHALKRRIDSKTLFYNPQCSLPSYEDLCIDLRIKNFYDQLNQGHSIRFKSVSPFGVTEVRLSAGDYLQELMTEKEAVKEELSRFETMDVFKPTHFSVLRGRIAVEYRPLSKAK
jgi:hypothetical protein